MTTRLRIVRLDIVNYHHSIIPCYNDTNSDGLTNDLTNLYTATLLQCHWKELPAHFIKRSYFMLRSSRPARLAWMRCRSTIYVNVLEV